MSDERLVTDIRDALESGYEPSSGIEDRVIRAIPWDERLPRRLGRKLRLAGAGAALLGVSAVVLFATTYTTAANSAGQAEPISRTEAIADAMRQLPNDGAGYSVLDAQLEPSSKHFDFVGPNGMEMGEDQVRECLVIPPLPRIPFFEVCRYYPVWVVAFSSPTCEVDVGINAYTGRFAGGGAGSNAQSSAGSFDQCQLQPESPTIDWFQPTWG